MVTQRANARPRTRFVAFRTALGAHLLLGFGAVSAFAGAVATAANAHADPQPVPVASAQPGATEAANRSIEALAETLAALDALGRGQGRATVDAPLFATAKASSKSQGFLCLIETEQDSNCPVAPTGNTTIASSQCTLCSSLERDRAWQRYVGAELGLRALDLLLALRLDPSSPAPTAERLSAWLKSLEATAPRGKALQAALAELFGAQTPKARSTAFYKQLQAVLAALELSMTPDDLGEEGGLRATLKLAGHTRDAARSDWQLQFGAWSRCHAAAISSGQLGLSDANEVERCNRRAVPGTTADPELQSYRQKQHARRACLDSALRLKLSIAQHQASACADGALISGR